MNLPTLTPYLIDKWIYPWRPWLHLHHSLPKFSAFSSVSLSFSVTTTCDGCHGQHGDEMLPPTNAYKSRYPPKKTRTPCTVVHTCDLMTLMTAWINKSKTIAVNDEQTGTMYVCECRSATAFLPWRIIQNRQISTTNYKRPWWLYQGLLAQIPQNSLLHNALRVLASFCERSTPKNVHSEHSGNPGSLLKMLWQPFLTNLIN